MAYHRSRRRRFGLRRPFKRSFRRRGRYNPRRRTRRYVKGRSRTGGYYGRYPVGGARAELKFFDDAGIANTITSLWTVHQTSINDIAQGTGESERVGRKITIRSVNCKGWMVAPSSSNFLLTAARVRLVLVQDKQCNGSVIAPLDVFETSNIDTYRNLANSGRFNILFDKTWNLNYKAAGGDGVTNATVATGQYFRFNRKVFMPIEFDGPTGGLTEIQSNNMAWMSISDSAEDKDLDYQFRIRYTDS